MRPLLILAALIPSLACADFTYDQARIDRERAEGEAKGFVYPDAANVARPERGTVKSDQPEIVDGIRLLPGLQCDHFLAIAPICPVGDPMEWVQAGEGTCRASCTTTTGRRELAAGNGASQTRMCVSRMSTDGCETTCTEAEAPQIASGASLVSPAR